MASEIVQVEAIENNVTDGNRQFGLRLVIPEEAQQLGIELGVPNELNITIIDDDGNITSLHFSYVGSDSPFVYSWRFRSSMLHKQYWRCSEWSQHHTAL